MGASGACRSRDLITGREPPPLPSPSGGREKDKNQNVTRNPTFSERPGNGAFGYTVVVRIDVGL
jgi:hypothetical protein